jgi:hypothetical protein
MAHIQKCIGYLLAKGDLTPTETKLAPAWLPDTETTKCMHCKKTVFTFLNRRHHCRKCGTVACNFCTTKRFLLPNQSSIPLRVCEACFAQLSLSGSGDAPVHDAMTICSQEEDLSGEERTPTQTELAPAWVPDTKTTNCMHCKKTVFSFVNRRHHCRQCGSRATVA